MVEAWDVQDDILLREAVEAGASLAALAAGAVRAAVVPHADVRCAALQPSARF
jgi:hypothetical protein